MKNEEDIFSQISTDKTDTSSPIDNNIISMNNNINESPPKNKEKKSKKLKFSLFKSKDNKNKVKDIKKIKNKKLMKTNTINYFSPANEFQKTTLEKNNLIEDNIIETNLGFSLKPLEEQWKYQKILLDYNILDFTSKYYDFFF